MQINKGLYLVLILLLSIILITGCSSSGENIKNYTLNLDKDGNGTIVEPGSPGKYEFKEDTIVTIKIEPDQNHKFSIWEGSDSNDITETDYPNQWKLTMDGDKSIKVVFEKEEYPLNIVIEGNGEVNESFGKTAQDYDYGIVVELTANSDKGGILITGKEI